MKSKKRGKKPIVARPKTNPKKEEPERNPVGRPTKYRPEFCQMLIDNMAKGYPYECFGAEIDTDRATMYRWEDKHPEFRDAKRRGLEKLLKFDMSIMIQGMTGQLRRVSKETPMLDANNEPMRDASGKVIIVREYAAATYGQNAHKYRLSNIHKWRDRLAITDDDGGPVAGMTDEQAKAALTDDKLRKLAEHSARLMREKSGPESD